MNQKYLFFTTCIEMILAFLFHFGYQLFPNPLFAIFFPVNESIWEHMKIISTSILFYGLLESFFFLYWKKDQPGHLFSLFITIVSSVVLYLLIYLPIHLMFGYHMSVVLLLLFLIFYISTILKHQMRKRKFISYEKLACIGICCIYISFGYLTYHPCFNFLFLDEETQKYGLQIYQI